MALITSGSKVYLGSTAIARIYIGSTLLADLLQTFDDDPGMVTTSGANLTTGSIAGTNPAALVHGAWIKAPEMLASETTLWLRIEDDAGTPRQAYVTVYDDGARLVSIYTRSSDGSLQPAVTEYIDNDLIVAGDNVCLLLAADAGGTLHSYQSRNGGNFTRGTGVAIAPGHTLPVYGAAHRFYDSDNIHTEGSFLWARTSLPAAFADLASLNAAKSSFVEADGTRASLTKIYGVLGEPLHAIYGSAEDYNAATDRGTSAGALTLFGSFADYVPPLPEPASVVQSTNQSLSVTTAAGEPTMWAAIVANWSYDVAGTAGNTYAWRTSKHGGGNLRFNGSGVPVATISVPTSLATTATDTLSGQRIHAAGEGASAILTLETNGTSGAAKLYEMAADGSISLAETHNFPDMTAFDMREAVITLLASNKTISTGGVGMWAGTGTIPAINPVTSPRDFFDLDGHPTGRDALSAIFGAQPMVAEFGDAAAWLDTTTDGSEAGTVTFGTTPTAGTITDVSPSLPTGDFAATSDSNAALLDGTAANYALTKTLVEDGYGSTAFDYSGVTLTASKSSIMLGEAVYLAVNGLTDEQRATWGFLWEFDTSGEFQFLEGCPWHIRQRNRAVGHHQTAAWNKGDGPGDKTVRVHIVPPVWTGLKGKTLSVTVTNRDPDVEFAGLTVYVSTDGDFTGVPAEVGATELVTTFADGYSRLKAWDGGRMRFKRGQTIPITSHTEISRAYLHGVMFDDWGSTANPLPILDISSEGMNWRRVEPVPFYVIMNLNHVGGYDGVTGTAPSWPIPSAYSVNAQGASITLNGCKFERMTKAVDSTNTSGGLGNHLSAYDTQITRWADFGLYTAEVDPHVRGCAIFQDPDFPVSISEWNPTKDGVGGIDPKNYSGPIDYANHGPMRFNKMSNRTVIASQLRCFSFTDWGGGGNSTIFGSSVSIVAGQPILRMGALDCENANALVTEIYSEGGGYSLGGGNNNYTVGSGFLAMHGCYHLLNAIWNKTSFGMTGAWCRDNVFLVPSGRPAGTSENIYSVFNGISDDQVTATWHTKPINCFNNTVVFLKSSADINNSFPSYSQIMEVAPDNAALVDLPEVNFYDNVLWAPNITLSGEAAPRVPAGLTRTGRYGPLPMYKGWHQIEGNTNEGVNDLGLYPEFATPPTAPELPIAGATYEGRGAGDPTKPHGALDFHGRIRAERDQGAVSYEVLKPAA